MKSVTSRFEKTGVAANATDMPWRIARYRPQALLHRPYAARVDEL
jgi:hypothetical protein